MSVRWMALFWLAMAGPVAAQGFAGLGTTAAGEFAVPVPDPDFAFPSDHGPHPGFRVEWWYLTASLTGADGQDYGAQWTLFRTGLAPGRTPGWDSPQFWMGHAALTGANFHDFAERLGRDGVGQAGVTAEPFRAWIDDWTMESLAGDGADALSELAVRARGFDWSYSLSLTATGPLVLQGDGGYSVKSAGGQSSYYYSQPFYEVRGSIERGNLPVEVTGRAWLDREWSSQPLSDTQSGWDWFSLHLESGEKVMGFRLRDTTGKDYTAATWIAADGTAEALPDGAFRADPLRHVTLAGRRVPVDWRVRIPGHGLDITTTPLNPQSWMGTLFPYWEGPVTFGGTHSGRGYLEMTGYE